MAREGDIIMIDREMESRINAAIAKVLNENTEFSNVARPKPTRASTATQGAWRIEKNPKASAATEGAWDATNTPGGVSAYAKKVWTKDELVEAVSKAAMTVLEFNNRKIEGEAKPSAVKIVSGFTPTGKVSASVIRQIEGVVREAAAKVISRYIPSGKISSATNAIWTKDQLIDAVSKATMTVLEFNNIPVGGETKPSSSKAISYDKADAKPAANKVLSDTMVEGKVSAATQPAFNKEEDYNHKKISASVCAQILTNVYKLNQ